jgi:hypothetical protein
MTSIETPEPTVPSPDNAADKARDVIAEWSAYEFGDGWFDPEVDDGNEEDLEANNWYREYADKLLAALDRAGLAVVSKEDVT